VALLLVSTFLPFFTSLSPGFPSAYAAEVSEKKNGFAPGLSLLDEQSPTIIWPTAADIVYGQTLSESTLVGGSVEYGSFVWADGAVKPNVPGGSYPVVFTPNKETAATYESMGTHAQDVLISVTKAPAPLIVWPVAEPLIFGKSVGEAVLTGGSTEYGSFVWAPGDAGIKPKAGTGDYTINFNPNADTQNNYETIIARSVTVNLTINKADPPNLAFPISSPVKETEGLKLKDISLSGGTGDGSFAWFAPDLELKAPGGNYDVVFTPTDTENYNTVVKEVYLAVISENTPVEDEYDSRYTSNTLTVRVGILGGKWKTLKTYDVATLWNTLPVYDEVFTWIDNGAFLVLQAVRGVELKALLEDALAADGVIGDLGDGNIQTIYFHTKDKGYHTSGTPEWLWGANQYYFPTLPRDWDFKYNNNPYGDSVAWASAEVVSPMIALEEYWHRVNSDEYRTADIYWGKITSGARFRLAWGMPSPTSMTGHDSAKYIDRIDLVFNADAVADSGTYGEYYGHFTENQEPGGGSGTNPGSGDDTGSGDGNGDGGTDGDGRGDGDGTDGNGGNGSDGNSGDGNSGGNNSNTPGAGGNGSTTSGNGTRENTDNRVVEITLPDGRTVNAQQLDPSELFPLSASPDLDTNILRGAELLQAQGLSLLEMVGGGANAESAGGKTVTIGESGVPLTIEATDPRVLLIVNLILAMSFVSGGVVTFMTGRITWLKGAFHWISAR
jgi:hypothetical protein